MTDLSKMISMNGPAVNETEFKAKTITGEEMRFRIIHWAPSKVFQRISMVGKYFYVPISMMTGVKNDPESFSEAVPAALLHLFNTLEENDVLVLLATMLDGVLYENKPATENFDKVFAGKNEVILQIVAKVLEVNYGPFFAAGFGNLITSIAPVMSLVKTD